MKEEISIIIPSFNSAKTIEHALKAIDGQTRKDLILEIIVVDSSDDEETKRVLSRYKSGKIKVIDAGIGTMPAIARNIGAGCATGKILVFLDADAYPAPDWLAHIVRANEAGYLVGGGAIAMADFQERKPLAAAQYYLQFNEYMKSGNDRVKKFVPSCNMFCDRKLFQKVGGFPKLRAAEDVVFGLKISKVADLLFIPNALVYHIFREDLKGFLKNQALLGKYVCVYRKACFDSFIYKGIMPLVLFPVFLVVKLFRIISRVSHTGWHHMRSFMVVIPVFLFGLLFWSSGFIRGCLTTNENPEC